MAASVLVTGDRNWPWSNADRELSSFFNLPSGWVSDQRAAVSTNVDVVETPDAHIFYADMPGVDKSRISVKVEEGKVLVISGERERPDLGEKGTWRLVERASGKFQRRFRLVNADLNNIEAKNENGVLVVTVPKDKKKMESKEIRIN